MIVVYLSDGDESEDKEIPELPVMTKWSSMVIDAVVRGEDISCLTPYRKWKGERKDGEK